jgi:hypothetical protein
MVMVLPLGTGITMYGETARTYRDWPPSRWQRQYCTYQLSDHFSPLFRSDRDDPTFLSLSYLSYIIPPYFRNRPRSSPSAVKEEEAHGDRRMGAVEVSANATMTCPCNAAVGHPNPSPITDSGWMRQSTDHAVLSPLSRNSHVRWPFQKQSQSLFIHRRNGIPPFKISCR